MRFAKRRAIAVDPLLLGFPLLAMIVSVAIAGNNLAGTNASVSICNYNALATNGSCQTGGTTTYSCPSVQQLFVVPCGIQANGKTVACPSSPPPPSYCAPITNAWLLPAGATITVSNGLVQAESSQSFFFGIGTIGPSGYIFIIGLVVSIMVLAGLTILGTGQSFESLHILFMGGMLMAIWLLLSTLDGFTTSNPGSMFVQLNAWSFDSLPIGTSVYVLLTFMYLLGFVGMVKRGS